jgi:hypothetical protein
MRQKLFILSGLIVVLVFGSLIRDAYRNYKTPVARSLPLQPIRTHENDLVLALEHGQTISLDEIKNIRAYVDGRYDCSDFKLQSSLRMLYRYHSALSLEMIRELEQMLLHFKYWLDEPGIDGMCYWSENHQLLFATAEYLAGQWLPDSTFSNSGLSGRQHVAKARARLLTWLKQRWLYGFSEWYSNVYYIEDIGPLSNLIDFARDPEIVTKSQIILDLLLYDMASQSYRGNFVTTSGRSYERGKKAGANASTRRISQTLFDYPEAPVRHWGMDINFQTIQNYKTPEIWREIGLDDRPVVIKASSGLDMEELDQEGLLGPDEHQIMMQWAMEAFTAPIVVTNSMRAMERYALFSNEFLHDFINFRYALFDYLHLYPWLSRTLHTQADGTALQRANTYTFKTSNYSMYTAQAYHPGEYGNQEHVFGVTLNNEISIFHTHPAVYPDQKPPHDNSPTYWVGNGHRPHAVQDENISLALYILPQRKASFEKELIPFTHLYLPIKKFDQVFLEGTCLIVRSGKTYVAFHTRHELKYDERNSEMIQDGLETYWICEIGCADQESFNSFIQRMRLTKIKYQDRTLEYVSGGKTLTLVYGAGFYINGRRIDTQYSRFDSPYIKVERKPEQMTFRLNDRIFTIHFDNMIRKEN